MFIERSNNIIQDLSKQFAIRIIKFYKHLYEDKHETVLSKQILRSGTSIGANIRESLHAPSKADFINKLNIALKEADETKYWLEILYESEIINVEAFNSLVADNQQIIATLVKIIKTTKENLKAAKQ